METSSLLLERCLICMVVLSHASLVILCLFVASVYQSIPPNAENQKNYSHFKS